MSISFHCQKCKKKIKAPDESGGKWGSCPHCKHRCYIPLPPSLDEEEIKLAPIDPAEETQYGQMMRETYNLTQNILHETASEETSAKGPFNEAQEKELTKNIIIYLRLMADGELSQAEAMITKISRFKPPAINILTNMAKTERPEPELADIAPKVLLGLIKDLHTKLG